MERRFLIIFVLTVLVFPFCGLHADRISTWWDKSDWSDPVVQTFDAASLPFKPADGIKAVMIKGVDFKGRASRFFCWYGVPESKDGKPVPGIVLVHGGGGFAFSKWVEMWVSRGYAAIALDTCGNIPAQEWEGRTRKPIRDKGHNGATEAEKYKVDIPRTEQWSYQAVAEIMLAHSFLRSLKGVDKNRIGVTGVSWGGYLTTLVAGVDDRFAFAIPVYGCGFFRGTHFYPSMLKRKRTEADFAKWCKYWDANNFLSNAKMPVLFVNGTNDFFFHLDSWTKTTMLPANTYMALQVKMGHSHRRADVPVVYAFADMVTKGAAKLPRLVSEGVKDGKAFAEFECSEPVLYAQYNYSTDDCHSTKRNWQKKNVKVSGTGLKRLEYPVPEGAVIGYFNIYIKNNYIDKPGMGDDYGKNKVFSSSRPIKYKTTK